eukprot:1389752-Amorphochlora_amoeboformis.AAC.1
MRRRRRRIASAHSNDVLPLGRRRRKRNHASGLVDGRGERKAGFLAGSRVGWGGIGAEWDDS